MKQCNFTTEGQELPPITINNVYKLVWDHMGESVTEYYLAVGKSHFSEDMLRLVCLEDGEYWNIENLFGGNKRKDFVLVDACFSIKPKA